MTRNPFSAKLHVLGGLLWVAALGFMLYRQWALPQPLTLTMTSGLAEMERNTAILELHGRYMRLTLWIQGAAVLCALAAWIVERFGRKDILPKEA